MQNSRNTSTGKLLSSPRTSYAHDKNTQKLQYIPNAPDIIITDIPYGNLVDWGGEGEINAMLRKLWEISGDDTILAVSMDKSQKVIYDCWKRIEKQNIGKRRFEILSKNTCYRLEKTT